MQLSQFTVTGNVLTLEVRSEIRQARFKAICRDMDQAVAALGRVRMVLVMRHYPSFNSAEDFYDDMRFLRLYDHAIDKVAVVCDRFWKDTWVGIFCLFSGIRMDFFEISQANAAARWIQGE
ncbi:MAG: STAS/SEC14 domain-containing protein [Desulfosarcina sp.]|nr:STAS/SEC14 domain-containing protein [Desulfosarcina sp.]MBC2741864.1 STAS/SEC14 domain-containing protein [Desulfosarcina sp.]MBC2764777.1 STAS/SEC14 domain-containing protein [Desulfosarcina sp.]